MIWHCQKMAQKIHKKGLYAEKRFEIIAVDLRKELINLMLSYTISIREGQHQFNNADRKF